ncbi:hypothetical protein GOP47_0019205 [Adiantum capillus-veneris]|uniref:Peptidyl-prolyl cis-trans isomerase n=1 Tax=Adiantum capillus-veneris TaxID=13818 RepID=A0A9D4ZBF0_ADICA|nr:hypothetical protein GOP47_0018390 [Adiantum capillus-veneris]KAI5066581.1 hypothetical protein GOP47_0019205 [Adiantum capillus-veneris]
MARIKPRALLAQSKQKKAPARFSRTFLFVGVFLIAFLLVTFFFRSGQRRPTLLEYDYETSVTGSSQYAVLNTSRGPIHLQLFKDRTPKTVENFVTHSKNGYYDGVTFHRVIKNFMIQSGDPLGDGTGGESIWGSTFEDEFDASLKHEPFTLSMANRGPNTNGAQFFITTVATPHLDNKHTVFGRVLKGQNVVKEIESVDTDAMDKPKSPVVIQNVLITDEL